MKVNANKRRKWHVAYRRRERPQREAAWPNGNHDIDETTCPDGQVRKGVWQGGQFINPISSTI